MNEIQKRAQQAHKLEQDDLEKATEIWQDVCVQWQDGTYNGLPFREWCDNAQQRHDQAEQARAAFAHLREWFCVQTKPEREQFNTYCEPIRSMIEQVEPAMRDQRLSRLEAALHLLERYQGSYAELSDSLNGSPDPLFVTNFRKVFTEIQSFDGSPDPLLISLDDVVKKSHDRLENLLNYFKQG
jgi:hypothetical protein